MTILLVSMVREVVRRHLALRDEVIFLNSISPSVEFVRKVNTSLSMFPLSSVIFICQNKTVYGFLKQSVTLFLTRQKRSGVAFGGALMFLYNEDHFCF